MKRTSVLALTAIFSSALIGTSVTAASPSCAEGDVAIVRLNTLTLSGTMDGFKKAVTDHAKWYADHGFKDDRFIVAPVLVYNMASKSLVPSPNQAMTIHANVHAIPEDIPGKLDAAWGAFVAEYHAHSTISSETMVCMPR